MKKLITQIKPNTSPVEWDGRPDNVYQKCGYHTCCCQVQNAFLAKSLRPVKPIVLALFLSVQFATAQINSVRQTASDSTIQSICGTTSPKNGWYADEYGQIWTCGANLALQPCVKMGLLKKHAVLDIAPAALTYRPSVCCLPS